MLMTPWFDPKAPAFISIAQKGGGFNLRTKSVAAAQARIAAFLACGDAPVLVGTYISVVERCSLDLLRAFFSGLSSSTWSAGSSRQGQQIEEIVLRQGHQRTGVAAELASAHGPPTEVHMVRDSDNQMRIQWTWVGTPTQYAGWAALAAEHSEMCTPKLPVVATTVAWDMRLRLRSGAIVDESLPASRFIPTFGGSYATAYCYFVLPQMPLTPELTDEWDHLTARTGVKIPLSKFELCAPKRTGDGRSWRKL
jgi:hypothetical protein